MLRLTVCGAFALLTALPSVAQNNKFTFNIGGGFTEPVRNFGRFDTGFNITAGAGVNFVPNFGLIAEFGFNHLDLTRRALSIAGVPDGSTRIYSVTLNPIIHLNPRGRFDAYFVGGGGYYRRTIEFTEPSIATVTAFDPFFGIFFPAAIPTNTVLGSFTQNKGGLNAGAGVSFRVTQDGNAKLFAESRYHYIYTSPRRTQILPVTFGLRW
ncbi:MAG TPA: outer membrane beta-barrel protein [Bryobacteraceae bacterium]|nr:outer membrane beta-barrel protein [Bryobacteraceae bacterium]